MIYRHAYKEKGLESVGMVMLWLIWFYYGGNYILPLESKFERMWALRFYKVP